MHAADLRQGILELAPEPERRRALLALAGLDGRAPPGLDDWPRALAPLAGLLVGLGVLMWVAANWGDWSRAVRFGLLQGLWLLALLGAWRWPRARSGFGLAALLLLGGLLAFFGQTYQTGADPWQLFALWAGITLPLALGLRSDWVWAPWTLVFALAVLLWTHAQGGQRWDLEQARLGVQLLGSALLLLVWLALGPELRRWSGAGPWAERALALWLALTLLGWGLVALFARDWGLLYLWAGLVLGGGLGLRWRAGDLVQLAMLALALNAWASAGLGRLLFDNAHGDPFGRLLLLGLLAAAMLAASVQLLMRRARAGEVRS